MGTADLSSSSDSNRKQANSGINLRSMSKFRTMFKKRSSSENEYKVPNIQSSNESLTINTAANVSGPISAGAMASSSFRYSQTSTPPFSGRQSKLSCHDDVTGESGMTNTTTGANSDIDSQRSSLIIATSPSQISFPTSPIDKESTLANESKMTLERQSSLRTSSSVVYKVNTATAISVEISSNDERSSEISESIPSETENAILEGSTQDVDKESSSLLSPSQISDDMSMNKQLTRL